MNTFPTINPQWKQDKEDIWEAHFENLKDGLTAPEKWFSKPVFYATAATFTLLIAFANLAFFYTKTVNVPRGKQLALWLPDDSKVMLNAETTISYKPLWWRVSRELTLDGEGYFEVKKGKTFQVVSKQANVQVLGTTFNVFARSETYRVTCFSGRVNVSNATQSVILTPNMQANWVSSKLETTSISNSNFQKSWTSNKFYFEEMPLQNVILEIERHYDISVDFPEETRHLVYSGYFTKPQNPNDALEIIGKPFDLTLKTKP